MNVLAIQGHNASLSGSSDCLISPTLKAVIKKPVDRNSPDVRILINEVLANGDTGNGADWIELYNPGPHPIDLTGFYLSDDAGDLLKYRLPDHLNLKPGEFGAVNEGTDAGMLPFGLSAAGDWDSYGFDRRRTGQWTSRCH